MIKTVLTIGSICVLAGAIYLLVTDYSPDDTNPAAPPSASTTTIVNLYGNVPKELDLIAKEIKNFKNSAAVLIRGEKALTLRSVGGSYDAGGLTLQVLLPVNAERDFDDVIFFIKDEYYLDFQRTRLKDAMNPSAVHASAIFTYRPIANNCSASSKTSLTLDVQVPPHTAAKIQKDRKYFITLATKTTINVVALQAFVEIPVEKLKANSFSIELPLPRSLLDPKLKLGPTGFRFIECANDTPTSTCLTANRKPSDLPIYLISEGQIRPSQICAGSRYRFTLNAIESGY